MQMLTLNVWREVYKQKKHIIYLKAQIFLFFSEALLMWHQITNKNTDYSATNKFKFKNTYRVKEKIIKGKI